MPWGLQGISPLADGNVEDWQIVPVSLDLNAVAYAFRINYPMPVPSSWQRAGFWAWLQLVEGQWVHSQTNNLPLLRVGGQQALTVIGPNQSYTLARGPNVYALAVSISYWVPRSSVEVWVLT